MGDASVRDARDECAEPYPIGARGEIGQRRIALEEVLPGTADLGDLAEVIHDIDGTETCGLGRFGDLPQAIGGRRRAARKREAAKMQAEPEPRRLFVLPPSGRRGLREGRSNDAYGRRSQDSVESLD